MQPFFICVAKAGQRHGVERDVIVYLSQVFPQKLFRGSVEEFQGTEFVIRYDQHSVRLGVENGFQGLLLRLQSLVSQEQICLVLLPHILADNQ